MVPSVASSLSPHPKKAKDRSWLRGSSGGRQRRWGVRQPVRAATLKDPRGDPPERGYLLAFELGSHWLEEFKGQRACLLVSPFLALAEYGFPIRLAMRWSERKAIPPFVAAKVRGGAGTAAAAAPVGLLRESSRGLYGPCFWVSFVNGRRGWKLESTSSGWPPLGCDDPQRGSRGGGRREEDVRATAGGRRQVSKSNVPRRNAKGRWWKRECRWWWTGRRGGGRSPCVENIHTFTHPCEVVA
ncbi:hypothetical protein B0H63DRAFT_253600 [Podospora didyma]|uniref:Uncharacterized protein n=1 Tax=Podospora didyma TaxID=330526 RepID=A0AAE0KEN6_9PEZI|nr:hypothetical protein B0H63DRAFT_253600 [Podospora didyma]